MKKKVSTLVLSIVLIFYLAIPACATDPSVASQIDKLEKEIAAIDAEMKPMDKGFNVIMGNVISTSPEFIVKGYGMGPETFATPAPYYVIEDPEHGSITGYLYSGPHKYLYTETRYDEYGNKVLVTHVGSMPARWLELRLIRYEKATQLKQFKADTGTSNIITPPLHPFEKYTVNKAKDIVLQINNPNMSLYGDIVSIDTDNTTPVLINGTTFLPIRSLIQNVGGTVDWDNASRSTTMSLYGNIVTLTLDSNIGVVNGREIQLDKPAQLVNGKMMVPLRFVAENLKMEVEWKNDEQAIVIHYSSKWKDHIGMLLTVNTAGDYVFRFADISCFTYPKQWGEPTFLDGENNDNTAWFKSGDIKISVNYWVPEENDSSGMADSIRTAFGGKETKVSLSEDNTGIEAICYNDWKNGRQYYILGDNGYIFTVTWEEPMWDSCDLPYSNDIPKYDTVKRQVQELVFTFSVDEAAG